MPFWIGYTGRREGSDGNYYHLPYGPTNRGRLNQTPKVVTANKAAAEVRSKILRKMRDLVRQTNHAESRWDALEDYIKRMAKRAPANKGGLGRK